MESFELLPEVAVKLVLSVLMSGLLGLERERKGQVAGLRTHILVCLGATLMIIVADRIAEELYGRNTQMWLDKGRVAAGIITGVGFLGAGTIINQGSIQRGLTTAAMIWFVAALGICIGAGYYITAFISTAVAFGTVISFKRIEFFIPSTARYTLFLRLPRALDMEKDLEQTITDSGFRATLRKMRLKTGDEEDELVYEIACPRGRPVQELIKTLRQKFSALTRISVEF